MLAFLAFSVALTGVSVANCARASTCSQAARSAELRNGLPAGLLTAIGHVESGGWGWSVNGNDGSPGRRFASAEDALRYTEELLGSGVRTIDLGCFQVDLRYHPEAFQRWQDGFDGDANADAAAGILTRLHAQTGDWPRAVALYHSADPQRGQSYLQAVMAAWSGHLVDTAVAVIENTHEVVLQAIYIPVTVWVPGSTLQGKTTPSTRQGVLPKIITP